MYLVFWMSIFYVLVPPNTTYVFRSRTFFCQKHKFNKSGMSVFHKKAFGRLRLVNMGWGLPIHMKMVWTLLNIGYYLILILKKVLYRSLYSLWFYWLFPIESYGSAACCQVLPQLLSCHCLRHFSWRFRHRPHRSRSSPQERINSQGPRRDNGKPQGNIMHHIGLTWY